MAIAPHAACSRGFAVALLLLAAGCATVPRSPLPADASLASRCERALAALDGEVDAAGVRDAQAARIAGFPAVRVTRFLASFAGPSLDEAAFGAWLGHLVAEDRAARRVEIANLPPAATRRVLDALAAEGFARLGPDAFVEGCGSTLAERDAADAARRSVLVASARVPDDYDDAARALGLYPLSRLAYAAGVAVYERYVRAAFAAGAPAPRATYVPDGAAPLAATEVRALLATGARDPLGVPTLAAIEAERLLATFAPVIDVDARSDDDRLGRPAWNADGTLGFAFAPVVYGRIAFTRFAGATHVQLVYTAWFRARPPAWPGDPLAGRLDGVLWRVTLGGDGAPIVYDAIHACGCYALFVATPRVVVRPAQPTLDEQALVVATLPPVAPGQRVAIALAHRTHQLRGVRVAGPPPAEAIRYRIAADEALRSLALPGGGARSLYGPDGFVQGTERGERMLFWPTGVASAGQIRQWGRHATAFVGRRHFDEPFLLDRYFLPRP